MKVVYQTFLESQQERMPICPPLLIAVDNSPPLPSIYTTGKVQTMIERRTDKREDLMQVVSYAPPPYTPDNVLRGLIKDWSGSGICLIARQPLDEGQEIIVSSVVVPKSKPAVVRWSKDLGNGSYQIGLAVRR